MNRLQKYKLVIFLCLRFSLTIIPQASSWTLLASFEAGVQGEDGFSYVGSSVDHWSSISHSGSYSARIFFKAGDTCWDQSLTCGALYNTFPSPVGNGGELWCKAYYLFPSGWSWADQNPGVSPYRKIMRFRVTNEGYITIDTYDSGEVLSNTEIGSPLYTHYTGSYLSPNSNHWYCIEQYVKFSTDPSQAIHRVWIDGVLVDEVLNHATLNSSTDVCNSVYFFTYWNMRVAQSQYAYIDDLVITTDRPANKDIHGNPMIGPESGELTPPGAPPNLRIK